MKEHTDETVHRFLCVCENHKWLSLMDLNHLNKNQNLIILRDKIMAAPVGVGPTFNH